MLGFRGLGRLVVLAAVAAAFGGVQPSAAQTPTPEPVKPVDSRSMTGVWYEVARIPNKAEKDCAVATSEWRPKGDGKFEVTQTCERDDKSDKVFHATAAPIDPALNAKWRMSYFGGLISRDYWVIDHGPDNGWVILGMPGKRFAWLMARQPTLPTSVREQLVGRMRALGFDCSQVVYPVSLAQNN